MRKERLESDEPIQVSFETLLKRICELGAENRKLKERIAELEAKGKVRG